MVILIHSVIMAIISSFQSVIGNSSKFHLSTGACFHFYDILLFAVLFLQLVFICHGFDARLMCCVSQSVKRRVASKCGMYACITRYSTIRRVTTTKSGKSNKQFSKSNWTSSWVERENRRETLFECWIVDSRLQFTPAKSNRVVAFVAHTLPAEIIHHLLNTETTHFINSSI